MRLRLLGSSAGGGLPQWNCACPMCTTARSNPGRVNPRQHCSLAFSGFGEEWYLIGAGPDVRLQIESFPPLTPGPEPRRTPLRGVLLPDAELDHTIGLLVLREGSPFDVYGTAPMLAALDGAFPVRRLLEAYTATRWLEVSVGKPLSLENGRLTVVAFPTGARRPRYAAGCAVDGHWRVGYSIADTQSGGAAVFAPSVEYWSPELEDALADADCAFVDGTFWSENEMDVTGRRARPAAGAGHLPIAGPAGSAARLAGSGAGRHIYVHVNNTNPILDVRSPERRMLDELGLEVGQDGMELRI
ncbi:MAG: pyrroloquinoline quinone biosynthesis protein PqqB [Candidatus Dormibacteraeota bacterium]|nr:pyrroloquinoline quinone biosynthesis protein PqqB [Candidatus Dormibacteraeota bacterium]